MTDKAKEEQEKVYSETKSPFKAGQAVKHIANPEFKMVIKEFAIKWSENQFRLVNFIQNPEYPICTYYNVHTNVWDEKMFLYTELEPDNRPAD